MKPNNLLPKIAAGVIAGTAATCPMTRLMEHLDGAKLEHPTTSLPPRTITAEALQSTSGKTPPESLIRPATTVAHYAYGGAVGSLFPLMGGIGCRSPLACGAMFGLGVWTASYLGILPGVGSSARATNRPPRVNGIMIAAHVVWGMSVAVLVEAQLRLAGCSDGETATQVCK